MIWEPFLLALVLGLVMSAGLYFAYLWPSVEPLDEPGDEDVAAAKEPEPAASNSPVIQAGEPSEPAAPPKDAGTP